MRSINSISRLFAVVAIVAAPLASIVAQAPNSGTVLHVSPYVGYMVFGSFLNGPLGTTLTNKAGMLYGTQVGLSLAPNISLVGNFGYTTGNLEVGVPIIGGVSVGTSSTMIYDADLEYNLGTSKAGATAFSPFVQAGVGAMKYDVSASVLTTHATNLAGNFGVGADFAVGRGVAIRVLAKDYIGKFDFKDATGFGIDANTAHNIGLTAGLRFDF
jgi:hypothetical protein